MEPNIAGFDLRSVPDGFRADPYPFYHALRTHNPVYPLPGGGFLLTRYDDLMAVYRDPNTCSSDKKVEFKPKYGDGPLYRHHTTSLVFNDPPLHTRVRRLLAPAFTPRALKLLEPRFVRMVDRLLDRAEEMGGFDVIADFASALPVEIIGEMLAVPVEERGPLREWSLAILGALEPVLTPEAEAWGNGAVTEFSDYLSRHIARFEAGALGDQGEVLGMLLQPDPQGDRLTREELIQNCIFLLNAGHETTTNLIGNGIGLLMDHPDALAELRGDPTLIEGAVEEFLRLESSNQLGNRRATTDAEIRGVAMPKGTLITLGIGAANRDPAQFAEPDRPDFRRYPNRHLAFGTGIHACAGMTLARMEGRIAIGRLLARFRRIDADGAPVRGGRVRFRGFQEYRLRVEP